MLSKWLAAVTLAKMFLAAPNTDSESAVKEPESCKKTEQSKKRKAYWIEKKNKKKLNRRSNETIPVILDMSDEMVFYRREKQLARRERFSMALAEGHQVVIDCGFEDLLTDKEIKSLAQQIMYLSLFGSIKLICGVCQVLLRSQSSQWDTLEVNIDIQCFSLIDFPLTFVSSVMLTSLRGMTLDALNNITGFDAWQSVESQLNYSYWYLTLWWPVPPEHRMLHKKV